MSATLRDNTSRHFASGGGHLQSSCVHIYTQRSTSDGKQDKSRPAISHQNIGPPARGPRVRHVLALAPPGPATHPPTRSLARSLTHSLTHSPATHSFSRRAAQHLLLLPQQGDRQRKRHDRLRKRDRSTESMRGFCGTSASDQEHDHDSMSHWLTRTHPHSPALARRQNNQRRSTRSTTTYSGFPSSCGRLTYHIM